MNKQFRFSMLLLLACLMSLAPSLAVADKEMFWAYSMREAVSAWRGHQTPATPDWEHFVGITRFVAAVHLGDDVILIGRRGGGEAGEVKASLDDFSVALKAALKGLTPSVSIDPTLETERTGLLAVHYGGDIENTQWGLDFANADIYLKMYSLNQVHPLPNIVPYRDMLAEDEMANLRGQGVSVDNVEWVDAKSLRQAKPNLEGQPIAKESVYQEKFWFTPKSRPRLAKDQGVMCIAELQLAVRRQWLGEQAVPPGSVGERFANSLSQAGKALAAQHAAVARLKILYDLYAIAMDIAKAGPRDYLLDMAEHYPIKKIQTPQNYPMTVQFGLPRRQDGVVQVIRLSGGVSFPAEIEWLNGGDISPLRDIVAKTRPRADSLAWPLPLQGWNMPNAQDLELPHISAPLPRPPGFVTTVQSFTLSSTANTLANSVIKPSLFQAMGGFPAQAFTPAAINPLRFEVQTNLGGVSMAMPDDDLSSVTDHTGGLLLQRNQALQLRP